MRTIGTFFENQVWGTRQTVFDQTSIWVTFVRHEQILPVLLACLTLFDISVLLRCIHHFQSDFINDMGHTRISGTEPSSVILSERKKFQKLKMYAQKCQNKVKPKGIV